MHTGEAQPILFQHRSRGRRCARSYQGRRGEPCNEKGVGLGLGSVHGYEGHRGDPCSTRLSVQALSHAVEAGWGHGWRQKCARSSTGFTLGPSRRTVSLDPGEPRDTVREMLAA